MPRERSRRSAQRGPRPAPPPGGAQHRDARPGAWFWVLLGIGVGILVAVVAMFALFLWFVDSMQNMGW
ncbi:MAG: hypothetical protein F4117_13305 [Acidimicrobiales bacterium]|nr:hypothetical protein [Acidimicrobiales bacterium]MYB81970.1 hypothetical protein [Acidimicrobiales bacterium]MYI13526.1 hypothetical protein [Acidimicrobiales bacterium]